MKLTDADILQLLPYFMRDDKANAALSRAINNLIQGPGSRVKQLRTWDKIGELDDLQLDELAWELNVDWYSSALPLDRKRETIRVSDQVQEKRGTKWAVEQLISAYFGSGVVQEWFEYEGSPYTFIVLTKNKNITDANFQEFNNVANAAKSVRSRMDGIFYLGEYGVAIVLTSSVDPTVFNFTRCGTKHKDAYIGKIMEQSVKASREITRQPFEISKTGTLKAGTTPKASTIGALREATVSAAKEITRQAFGIVKAGTMKTGLSPRVSMKGQLLTAGSMAASSSITRQSFDFIKCGTRKTME